VDVTGCLLTTQSGPTTAFRNVEHFDKSVAQIVGGNPTMLRRAVASLVVCGLFVCILYGTANTAELKIFTSRATATVLEKIGPEFEQKT
jgi:hypothetical protein